MAQDASLTQNSTLGEESSTPTPAFPLRREATQAEIDSLPHVADRVPLAAWAVVVAGAAERATYFGIISPWRRLMVTLFFLPTLAGG